MAIHGVYARLEIVLKHDKSEAKYWSVCSFKDNAETCKALHSTVLSAQMTRKKVDMIYDVNKCSDIVLLGSEEQIKKFIWLGITSNQ